jgi:lipopolysaccharide export system permease protein
MAHSFGKSGRLTWAVRAAFAALIPTIITRYIMRELTMVFLFSCASFVTLLVVAGIAREGLAKGLTAGVIAQLLQYIVPEALMFALPATVLFSICSVYGRVVAANEVIAVRSMGVSPRVLMRPALVFALIASFGAVWINDVGFAWSHWGIETTVMKSFPELAYNVLKNEGVLQTDSFKITVDAVEGTTLQRPVIEVGGRHPVYLQAAEGSMARDTDGLSVTIQLRDGSITSDSATVLFEDEIEYKFPLVEPGKLAELLKNPAHLYMSEIPEAMRHDRRELVSLQRQAAMRAASQMLGGDLVGLTNPEWGNREKRLGSLQDRIQRMRIVPHRRWANGFSCLAFAVIGIPVAMRLGKADFWTTFGVCFLPIVLFYYPLFMVGLDGAKNGSLPSFAPWTGNLFCFACGSYLIYRECSK